jgi:dTDP-4-dehydrorhamnose 3,5-epimerase
MARGAGVKFLPTAIDGVFVVDLERIEDHRGFFARLWSASDFAATGVDADWVQCNVGHSTAAGTIRGLHYQVGTSAEAKLVWCGAGGFFDVAVDLRAGSATRFEWVGVELTSVNRRALFLPPGTAHGYQTLVPDTDLWYLTSQPYDANAATGARWDDPAFGIRWPQPPGPRSDQDAGWPLQTLESEES